MAFSNEDQINQISKTVFVTNFPDHIRAQDLWGLCKVYGSVVDVYIPFKKSKTGKRFAFICFIKVNNLERLIENLCTILIGSFHLYANTVCFNRKPRQKGMFNNSNMNQNNGKGNFSNTTSVGNSKGSFASILKEGVHQQPVTTTPTLVLDDLCLKDCDFSSSLMCQVKDVTAIPNLHIILSEEGFQSIHITYLGGLWVLIKFESFDVLEKFCKHVGISSWFSSIKPPINSFVSNERIVWISIEGLPINAWTSNTFSKFAQKWGDLIVIIKGVVYWIRAKELDAWVPKFLNESDNSSSEDDFYDSDEGNKDDEEEINSKQDDIEDEHVSVTSGMHEKGTSNDKEVEHVSETCDMQQEEPINDKDTSNPKGDNSQSSDPFNIYKLLRKKENKHHHSKDSGPSHPPGFTPEFVSVNKEEGSISVNNNQNSTSGKKSVSYHNVKVSNTCMPITGGSILDVMDDLVKVCWGNLTFDHAVSPSVGNSGDVSKKRDLWDYLCTMINRWEGETVVMGDFNEVCTEQERFGTYFNIHGANVFNKFISLAGLVDIPLGGYSYTWAHKSSSKMSKLDRFLITEGFDKFVEEKWNDMNVMDSNALIRLKKKLQLLKVEIKAWVKERRNHISKAKTSTKCMLTEVDKIIDQGKWDDDILIKRASLMKELNEINSKEALDVSQKAKIRWSIEGDENSKYFHGILNSKRSQLSIRGILHNGDWIVDPIRVKAEFFNHFSNQFSNPSTARISLDSYFPNRLKAEQAEDLECNISYDEIKKAVWDCGTNKSPGPDGFTFEFFRKFWNIMSNDIVAAVTQFFSTGIFPPGCNSNFIALIPKTQDAKVIKDFRPISLIGSIYKIIAKILANRLSMVISDLINEVQTAFVPNRQILDGPFILNELISWCKHKKINAMIFKIDFEKAFDSVRWDYLDDILKSFGFGDKWRSWIAGCLNSAKDDAVFVGEWNISNIKTIVRVLKCFFMASGLKINLSKSKLSGIGVSKKEVD
ncbi:RNA-directed DNA polymerase, eukaryota [Tanacetum coccineum]|uniref:RNA-directed DNA polymerase, eukaryota n=1 Tax=Tanacetum coccineum TaxID=301880 RepID=A0ABQ5FHB5_9ASTR